MPIDALDHLRMRGTTARALLLSITPVLCGPWLGCGYHTAGHANTVPGTVKAIAIPAFANATSRYKLTDQLPAAIAREFISRTRYRVVADPSGADAILTGSVRKVDISQRDQTTVQVTVSMNLTLRETATNTILYERSNMEVRQFYEISTDPAGLFEEGDPAMIRLSRDVGRAVVTGILVDF